MGLVTVMVYDNPVQANFSRALLESQGIAAYLFDEHTVGVNPLISLAIGGIKLKVNESDFGEAERILAGAA